MHLISAYTFALVDYYFLDPLGTCRVHRSKKPSNSHLLANHHLLWASPDYDVALMLQLIMLFRYPSKQEAEVPGHMKQGNHMHNRLTNNTHSCL